MSRTDSWVTQRIDFSLEITGDDTWHGDLALEAFGRKGRITTVVVREDTGGDLGATEVCAYDKGRAGYGSDPPAIAGEFRYYYNPDNTMTADAEVPSIVDSPEHDGGSFYDLSLSGAAEPGDMRLAFRAPSGAGTLVGYIIALVQAP